MEPNDPNGLDEKVERLTELHAEMIEGRMFADIVPDAEDRKIMLAMAKLLLHGTVAVSENMDLEPSERANMLLTQVLGVGIFFAEIGRTVMTRPAAPTEPTEVN